MNLKRKVLFSAYTMLKQFQLIDRLNQDKHFANIVTYHRVNNYDNSQLTTPVKEFDRMMRQLSNDYNVISLYELIDQLNNKRSIEPKTVVITFDDGYKDNYECAASILNHYKLPATYFITSGYINTNKVFEWDRNSSVKHPLMTWGEVRELSNMGFDIGAHTVNHINLGKASNTIARDEIKGSKTRIEDEINKEINLFAYPFGGKDYIRSEIIDIVKEEGLACCCSNYGGKVTGNSNLYNLHRIPTYPNTIELMMELDNLMTFYDGRMSFNFRKTMNSY